MTRFQLAVLITFGVVVALIDVCTGTRPLGHAAPLDDATLILLLFSGNQ